MAADLERLLSRKDELAVMKEVLLRTLNPLDSNITSARINSTGKSSHPRGSTKIKSSQSASLGADWELFIFVGLHQEMKDEQK